jgi:hypothetical protein
MPTPFNAQVFTFTQPDGSPIQLRGWGNQHYAVFETLDGYTVTRNPGTGYYEVAQLSPGGDALQPADARGVSFDGAAAGVPRGLRVRRESAMAAGREAGVKVLVDADGETLQDVLLEKPTAVTPNRNEAAALLNKALITRQHFRGAALRIRDMGAQAVVLSLGGRGAVGVRDGDGAGRFEAWEEAVAVPHDEGAGGVDGEGGDDAAGWLVVGAV